MLFCILWRSATLVVKPLVPTYDSDGVPNINLHKLNQWSFYVLFATLDIESFNSGIVGFLRFSGLWLVIMICYLSWQIRFICPLIKNFYSM